MAAISLTATGFYQSNPRLVHAGINVAKGVFQSVLGHAGTTSTITASDRIWMIALPANCVVIDGYLSGHVDNDATIYKVGAVGSTGTMSSTLATLLTLSATPTLKRFLTSGGNAGVPMTMSASDDVPIVYVAVECTTAGSNTTTVSLVLVLQYVAKGQI